MARTCMTELFRKDGLNVGSINIEQYSLVLEAASLPCYRWRIVEEGI